jgi:hypothetical protein
MGNLQWAYLHNAVREWLGEDGDIKSISCQFRAANLRNTIVSVAGVVTEVTLTQDGTTVTIDLRTENDAGQTLAPGQAVVFLPDSWLRFYKHEIVVRCQNPPCSGHLRLRAGIAAGRQPDRR